MNNVLNTKRQENEERHAILFPPCIMLNSLNGGGDRTLLGFAELRLHSANQASLFALVGAYLLDKE